MRGTTGRSRCRLSPRVEHDVPPGAAARVRWADWHAMPRRDRSSTLFDHKLADEVLRHHQPMPPVEDRHLPVPREMHALDGARSLEKRGGHKLDSPRGCAFAALLRPPNHPAACFAAPDPEPSFSGDYDGVLDDQNGSNQRSGQKGSRGAFIAALRPRRIPSPPARPIVGSEGGGNRPVQRRECG